ncbi:MAG: T9SS C-terminal target domain-containing protein [Ignavibacteriae bacterium]|nr:MAG: T9SS C-terminal target domain-containing protein [Ignavibacteriota bacterium]
MARKFLLLLLFSFIQISQSQIIQQWTREYPTISYSAFINTTDDSGNVYTAGGTVNGDNSDFLLIKYDSSGNQLWLKTYNGPADRNDFIKCITKDKFGFIYVSGESEKINGEEEFCTQKYNAAGTLLWTARYNSVYDHINKPVAMALDKNGNIFITGKCGESSNNPQKYQFLTLKYNNNGDVLWFQYFGQVGSNDEPVAIALDSTGNCIITGRCNCTNYLFGIITIKYSPAGTIIWENEIPPLGFSGREPFLLKTDKYNNIIISGITEDSVSGYHYRFFTIKYNSKGAKLWEKIYRSSNTSIFPYALLIDKNGNSYVAGTEHASTYNSIIVLYDSSGNFLWTNTYDSGGNESVTAASFDTAGNIILTGSIKTGSTNNDVFVLSYSTERTQLFTYRYIRQENDFGSSVSINKYNNMFITGYDSASVYKIITIKFRIDGSVGVKNKSNEIPVEYSLSQNYPNPFNPKTIINYQLAMSGNVKLSIIDINGREVALLINQKQNAGSYNVEWNASNFASGVYFYKIVVDPSGETDNFSDVKKMILIK